MVREASAEVMIEKYRINLTFLLLFASLLFSFFIFVLFLLLQRRSGLPYDNVINTRGIKQGGAVVVAATTATATTTTTNAFEQRLSYGEGYCTIIIFNKSMRIPRHDTRVVQGYQIN